jgi:hypothetical protein
VGADVSVDVGARVGVAVSVDGGGWVGEGVSVGMGAWAVPTTRRTTAKATNNIRKFDFIRALILFLPLIRQHKSKLYNCFFIWNSTIGRHIPKDTSLKNQPGRPNESPCEFLVLFQSKYYRAGCYSAGRYRTGLKRGVNEIVTRLGQPEVQAGNAKHLQRSNWFSRRA